MRVAGFGVLAAIQIPMNTTTNPLKNPTVIGSSSRTMASKAAEGAFREWANAEGSGAP